MAVQGKVKYFVRRRGELVLVQSVVDIADAQLMLRIAEQRLAWLRFVWHRDELAKRPRHDIQRLDVRRGIGALKREMPYLVDACYWQKLCRKLGPGIVD